MASRTVWSIDFSGELAAVVEHVRHVVPQFGDNAGRPVEPNAEDLRDLERVRGFALAELADLGTPYAGVCARYRDNREPLGGHELSLSVSGFDRLD